MSHSNIQELEQRFISLAPFKPRRFIGPESDLTKLKRVVNIYEQHLNQPIKNLAELEDWLAWHSEIETAVGEACSRVHILMTCATDNPEREAAYKQIVTELLPALKPLRNRFEERLLESADQFSLSTHCPHYALLLRTIKTSKELFHSGNIELEKECSLIGSEYQKCIGAMTVTFNGKERTLPEMAVFLKDPKREVREQSWRLSATRRLKDCNVLEEYFDELLLKRHQIAGNLGFQSYVEYCFKEKLRFDYSPADCVAFHDNVAKHIVPLCSRILEKRRSSLGLPTLKPWDLDCDVDGRSGLKPFNNPEELLNKTEALFKALDPELHKYFVMMRSQNLFDLASRKGKAPGAYCGGMNEARLPFIFMNAVGTQDDVNTFLHEVGHAFHLLMSRAVEPFEYREVVPMEMAEVASMAMELIGMQHIKGFYPDPHDEARSRADHLEDTILFLPWGATIDAFQHWLYTHPSHSREERRCAWLEIHARFFPTVDWSELSNEREYMWHRQPHLYLAPFYYIEYCYAQVGALNIWRNLVQDRDAALVAYKRGLSHGGALDLVSLYRETGIAPDFRGEKLKELATFIAPRVVS